MSQQALLRLQSIEFEGAGPYRRGTGPLRLANQGRVLIAGAEGSGKSMIPEVATLVLYSKGSPRVRKAGLVESSIVNPLTGYMGKLVFDSGMGAASRRVAITQAFKHKREKSKFIIKIDGKRDDEMPTSKPEQRKLVKRLAPLSYGEWLGVVYLHQSGVHDLLAGSPTEKRDYLTSVFGLDFYDDLLTEAVEERKRLAVGAVAAVELQRRLADVVERYTEVRTQYRALPHRDEAASGVQRLSERLQGIAHDLGRTNSLRTAIAKRASLEAQVATLWSEHPAWRDWLDVEAALTQAKTEMRALEGKRARLETDIAQLKQNEARYQAARLEYEQQQARLAKDEQAVAVAEQAVRKLPSEQQLHAGMALLSEARALVVDDVPLGQPSSEDWREAAHRARHTMALFDKLQDLNTGCCPTCTREVTGDELVRMRQELEGQMQREAQAVGAALAGAVAAIGLPATGCLMTAASLWGAHQAAHRTAATSRAVFERTKAAYEAARKAVGQNVAPSPPGKLEAQLATTLTALDAAHAAVDEAQAALGLRDRLATLLETTTSATPAELDAEIVALEQKKARTAERYQEALALKQRIDGLAATLRQLKHQREELEEEAAEQADAAARLLHYENVLVPYFTALRAGQVHACVSVLEGVLPVYVSAIASAQYRGAEVKLQVSEDLNDLDLLLRSRAHEPWLSPVQNSGGERQRFTVAIIGALREVSPRKANVMFWDEPFGAMESEGKLLVMNRLLPLLQERCPDLESIFIIAHDTEVLSAATDSFDSVWTVNRDERGSIITTGQRLAMVAAV